MNLPASRCTPFRALPWLAIANFLGICAAIAAFSALLWPEWRHDDNLSHGIFLPFLAGILIMESRRTSKPHFLEPGRWPLAACTLLALCSLGSFAVAIAYAAALGWTHSMTEFLLAVALVFALAGAWLGFADGRVRFIPVNWAAAVAVILWLFASPPPPGTYARLALFLQTQVADGVVRTLNAFGIAAFQEGSVIELARTSVGVSEACSGVRSLISCTVAGLFLSAFLVRRPMSRALVVALSPVIGIGMNFLRSFALTVLANSGVNIEGRWHDLTGASIIVATTLLVAALAQWLHRREPRILSSADTVPPSHEGHSPLHGVLAACLLTAALVSGFIVARHQPFQALSGHEPDLSALLPAPPLGWTVTTTSGLDQYSDTLHTHNLVERIYSAGPSLDSAHITIYLAYWLPGEAPVSLVDAHTPDACWPGTGWVLKPMPVERAALSVSGRRLPAAECRLFALNNYETHVWFWHLRGGRPLTYVDPYSAARLLGLAIHYGFSPPQDQLFIRVSSNRPWEEVASQPSLQQLFENLKPLGL